jgi:hypothetical protein
MRHKIDRLIRSRKTIIGIVVTLLIILLAKNFLYLPGVCQQQPSITIIDESKSKQNPYFQSYVTTISKHFSTKMNQLGKCHYAELFFIYRPLASSGIEPFNFELTKSNDTRFLDSPWLKLTLTNSYKPIARAAFFWNERQFLLDQALMSGVHADSTKPLLPIDVNMLNQFAKDYQEAETIARNEFEIARKTPNWAERWAEIWAGRYSKIIAYNARKLPLDILWMFNQGSGFRTTDKVVEQSVSQYTDMTKSLLDRRFSSVQIEQHYQNVLDLKDIFNIDKYRIK